MFYVFMIDDKNIFPIFLTNKPLMDKTKLMIFGKISYIKMFTFSGYPPLNIDFIEIEIDLY